MDRHGLSFPRRELDDHTIVISQRLEPAALRASCTVEFWAVVHARFGDRATK